MGPTITSLSFIIAYEDLSKFMLMQNYIERQVKLLILKYRVFQQKVECLKSLCRKMLHTHTKITRLLKYFLLSVFANFFLLQLTKTSANVFVGQRLQRLCKFLFTSADKDVGRPSKKKKRNFSAVEVMRVFARYISIQSIKTKSL